MLSDREERDLQSLERQRDRMLTERLGKTAGKDDSGEIEYAEISKKIVALKKKDGGPVILPPRRDKYRVGVS